MEATNLLDVLKSKKAKAKIINVYLSCGDFVLLNNDFNTGDFNGGFNEFAKVVNRLTKPFKDDGLYKNCKIMFTFDEESDSIYFEFLAGKFAPKLNDVINAFVQKNNKGGLGNDKEINKLLKNQLISFLSNKVNGFLQTIDFINLVEKMPTREVYFAIHSLNTKILSNE